MLGEQIKAKRMQKKITLRDLAKMTNISHPYLSQIENGHVAPENIASGKIQKIMEVLSDYNNDFGEYLKVIRESKGLTIQELADSTNVSRPYISQIESGKKKVPTFNVVVSLAEKLGVDRYDFLKVAGYEVDKKEQHEVDISSFIMTNKLVYGEKEITPEQKNKILTMLNVILN